MDAPATSAATLRNSISSATPPLVIDVRRNERFREAPDLIQGALRRDPLRIGDWAARLPQTASVVVYCVRGHEVSREAAKALLERGISATFLEGGIEHWRFEGGGLRAKPTGAGTRWVTRERPKIDRIACPWLVRRFIDPEAEFLYVPTTEVSAVAAARKAVPYDVPDVEFSHQGDLCSFDAFLDHFHLHEPALDELARIVRAADTNRMELAPQSAGLAAISLGLSINFPDDLRMLEQGMIVYDALYSWCKKGKAESHTWNPDLSR